MSPIEYNQEMQKYSSTVKDSISEEGVHLPFPAAVVRWMNGDNRNKKLADATYFGGWAASKESMDDLIAQSGIGLHPSFVLVDKVNKDGKEYEDYISRSIIVAICAKRKQSILDENKVFKYTHVQWVALAGELSSDKKSFSYWAPVMLTAKSNSAVRIEKALSQWDSITAAARREFAGGMPSQFFWAVLGTFGDQPVTETMGKGNQKSPITPCDLWKPKEFNDAIITRHFVGAENMKLMAELAEQTSDWRKAWVDKAGAEKPGAPDNFASDQTQPEVAETDIPF